MPIPILNEKSIDKWGGAFIVNTKSNMLDVVAIRYTIDLTTTISNLLKNVKNSSDYKYKSLDIISLSKLTNLSGTQSEIEECISFVKYVGKDNNCDFALFVYVDFSKTGEKILIPLKLTDDTIKVFRDNKIDNFNNVQFWGYGQGGFSGASKDKFLLVTINNGAANEYTNYTQLVNGVQLFLIFPWAGIYN